LNVLTKFAILAFAVSSFADTVQSVITTPP